MYGSWCGGFACVSTSRSEVSVYTAEGAACIQSKALVRSLVAEVSKSKPVSESPLKRFSDGTVNVEIAGEFWVVDP